MIKTFQNAKLPNAVYVQFMDYITTTVQEKNPEILNVKQQFDFFSQRVIEMKNLYKSSQPSNLSESINEADTLRDQILTGLIKIVDGNTYSFSEEMRTYAHLLEKNISNYGSNIIRNDLQTETAKIESIVKEWRSKPELTSAMIALQLVSWISELENANNDFKHLYALRTDEYSQMSDENMQGKRREVSTAYEDLCRHLNSLFVLNSSPVYDAVIAEINVYVEQYAALLKQRRSSKQKAEDSGQKAESSLQSQ